MNKLQKQIHDDLLSLTKAENGAFYYVDNKIDEVVYRIFSYRLIPRFSTWLVNDSALECRGITFEMGDNDQPVRLVSWPFEKFFNLNENPLTTGLDLSEPRDIVVKRDGSLMSSMHLKDGSLYLKSKASLYSEQAIAANELIRHTTFSALYEWTLDWAKGGYTVIFEYTSPFNRIVVPYKDSTLTVLAIRNNADGSYVDIFGVDLPPAVQRDVVVNLAKGINDPIAFIRNISAARGLEGYVVRLASRQRVKIKTEWYNALHKSNRYNGLSPARLTKAVLDGRVDDLRAMYADSPDALEQIDSVTSKVTIIYNETVKATTDFYDTNKALSRREFAILAKKELTNYQFGLVMKMFVGKPVDFAGSVFEHLKKDGISF